MSDQHLIDLEDRLAQLKVQLDEQQAAKVKAQADVESAYVEGKQNANAKALAVAEADARIGGLEGAIGTLTEQLQRARTEYAEARAAELVQEGATEYASLATRKEELAGKRTRLQQQLAETEREMLGTDERMASTAIEAHVIAHRFNMPCSVPRPPQARFGGAFAYTPNGEGCKVTWKAGSGRVTRILSGGAGRVLALAGPMERNEQEVLSAMHQTNREEQARHQQRRDAVDAFLRDLLKDGPVERDSIFEQARQKNIPAHADNNSRGASLMEARSRLRVVTVVQRDDEASPPYWSLPGAYEPEEWKAHAGRRPSRVSEAMRTFGLT